MAAICHLGGWGSALKSRNTEHEQWEASPARSTDIDLYHNNLLPHLCSGYFQGGSQRHAWWMVVETSRSTAKLEAKDSICFVSRALRHELFGQWEEGFLFNLVNLLKWSEFIKVAELLL